MLELGSEEVGAGIAPLVPVKSAHAQASLHFMSPEGKIDIFGAGGPCTASYEQRKCAPLVSCGISEKCEAESRAPSCEVVTTSGRDISFEADMGISQIRGTLFRPQTEESPY